MKRKTLIALAFTAAVINPPVPALSIDTDSSQFSANEFIQELSRQKEVLPELRAYHLLIFAQNVIDAKGDLSSKSFDYLLSGNDRIWWLSRSSPNLMLQLDAAARRFNQDPNKPPINISEKALAIDALNESVANLPAGSDTFRRISLYFVASSLYQELGDHAKSLIYAKIVDDAIRLSESGERLDPETRKAASTILNSKANAILPVTIPSSPSFPAFDKSFSERDFKKAEALRLQAVAILDRLDVADHDRRKAHRDMALWYLVLGKDDKFAKQKQILFSLVGIHADQILFPTVASCGRLVWWVAQYKETVGYDCGMG